MNHPTKQQGHDWMESRARERKPLPDIKTIRQEMGIDLIDAQKEAQFRADIQNIGSVPKLP